MVHRGSEYLFGQYGAVASERRAAAVRGSGYDLPGFELLREVCHLIH
jgi:hypothetical protein